MKAVETVHGRAEEAARQARLQLDELRKAEVSAVIGVLMCLDPAR